MNPRSIHINDFKTAYFIGVGGIGMSAIARYFKQQGWTVGGYDKTPSALTQQLEQEGITVHYKDYGPNLPEGFQSPESTLVVYTPAIPSDLGEFQYVQSHNYPVFKRAEVLGMITRDSKALCVAGTHGKTTTSTLLAHLLNTSTLKCNAFLGGISSNFNSNFISDPTSEITVIEADEFDRSFLQLNPFGSIVTSTDADHLDIYGDDNAFQHGFQEYANRIAKDGFLIRHISTQLSHPTTITYGCEPSADFYGHNMRFDHGEFLFDVTTPQGTWEAVELGIPGIHNAENAIACLAMCLQLGISETIIRTGLRSFKGVKRRFEYHIKSEKLVYIDDYAHHPTEIEALISSVKLLYPHQRITGVFQPHLFSRTRDFFEGFVRELSRCDEVILLPIYPAREAPIEGITSDALCENLRIDAKSVLAPTAAVDYLSNRKEGVILTIGAGDIDRIVEPLTKALRS